VIFREKFFGIMFEDFHVVLEILVIFGYFWLFQPIFGYFSQKSRVCVEI